LIVTLWRHGEAAWLAPDADRPLTEAGRAALTLRASELVQWLSAQANAQPSDLLHSPYRRTRETADLIAPLIGSPARDEAAALAPGCDERGLFSLLDKQPHLVIVSHQPFISEMVKYWLDDPRQAFIGPSGYAVLEVSAPCRGGAELLRLDEGQL
jgi:phosphohistidine phosphatase SixA